MNMRRQQFKKKKKGTLLLLSSLLNQGRGSSGERKTLSFKMDPFYTPLPVILGDFPPSFSFFFVFF